MSAFKVLNYSNLFLRCFSTLQRTSSICQYSVLQSNFRRFSSIPKVNNLLALNNLKCFTPLVLSSCGMKSKGHLQLRCKDCYFERKDGEMYVFCHSYPRHKQQLRRRRLKKFDMILSYSCTSKLRPY